MHLAYHNGCPSVEIQKNKQQRAVVAAARHMFTFIAMQSECFIAL